MSEVAGQTMLIVGTSGSGKTNNRVSWIVRKFLADPEAGGLVTNLPLKLDAIKEYYDRLHEKGKSTQSGTEVIARVQLIDRNVLDRWAKQKSTPFSYCENEVEFPRYRMILDEISDYYSDLHGKEHQLKFQSFVDQFRHIGEAGIELITQTADKLPARLKSSVEVRVDTVGCKVRRDGFWNIPFYAWYQVKAILTGQVVLSVFYIEKTNVGGKFVVSNTRKAFMDQQSFDWYDSFSAVENSDKQAERPKFEYERLGAVGTLKWFLKEYWWNLISGRGTWILYFIILIKSVSLGSVLGAMTAGLRNRVPNGVAKSSEPVEDAPEKKKVKPVGQTVDRINQAASGGYRISKTDPIVSLIDDSGAVLDGIYWHTSEAIEIGGGKSSSLESLDLARGFVRLSDGRVVRLQRAESQASPRAEDDRGVRGISVGSRASGGVAGRIANGLGTRSFGDGRE